MRPRARFPALALTLLVLLSGVAFPPAQSAFCEPILMHEVEMSSQGSTTSTTSTDYGVVDNNLCDVNNHGGGTFQSEWRGQTYSERSHPLERFTSFPVANADSEGRADLASIPRRAAYVGAAGSLDHVTDADIDVEMARFGVTRDDVANDIQSFFAPDPDMDSVRTSAAQAVLDGRFRDAMVLMRGSTADVTYWCGPEGAPIDYPWVVLLPVTLPCGSGEPAGRVAVLAGVVGVPDYRPVMENNLPAGVEVAALNLTIDLRGLDAADQARASFAIGYGRLVFSAETNLQKTWVLELGMRNLETYLTERTGHARWNANASAFSAGDVFALTDDRSYRSNVTTSWTMGAASYHGVEFLAQRTEFSKLLSIQHYDPNPVVQTRTTLVQGQRQLEITLENRTDGLSTLISDMTRFGRAKLDIELGSPTSTPYRDAELKATLYDGPDAVLDVQLKGLPGDETAPETTFAARTVIRLDFGTPDQKRFSFDMTKDKRDGGFYRAVVITSRHDDFPFRATASLVGRVQYSIGEPDPWTAQQRWHFVHSANLVKTESNSTMRSDGDVTFDTKWDADGTGTSAPTSQSWTYGPANVCGSSCSGTMGDGQQYVATNGTVNARFWAVHETQGELQADTCRFVYPAGDCA